jgi:hypothetical protein
MKPAQNVDSAWKPVVSRKTKRRQHIYPPAERRIVVQLAEASNDAQKAADTALRTVNRALVVHPDVTVPPLYTAYVSRTNALVFTAGPRNRGCEYQPFLGIIRNALAEIPTLSAHVSQRWTRYVLNGIPTATTLEDAQEEIEMLDPAAKLAKAPRWLTTAENRQEKAASSKVIHHPCRPHQAAGLQDVAFQPGMRRPRVHPVTRLDAMQLMPTLWPSGCTLQSRRSRLRRLRAAAPHPPAPVQHPRLPERTPLCAPAALLCSVPAVTQGHGPVVPCFPRSRTQRG